MTMPALLTRVSRRPNRASAVSMTRSAPAGSAISPSTAGTSGSFGGLRIVALASIDQPRPRYPATRPAPIPSAAPVMTATLPVMTRPAPAIGLVHGGTRPGVGRRGRSVPVGGEELGQRRGQVVGSLLGQPAVDEVMRIPFHER